MGNLKKVLLTGATGFLGSHLLELLLSKGHNVILTKRSTSDLSRIKHVVNNCRQYNIDKETDLDGIISENGIDAIIHTATNYGREDQYAEVIESNVLFPVKLIEAGIRNGVKLFINTDSFFAKDGFEYGHLNAYIKSKRMLCDILRSLSNKIGVANLRMEHIFGTKDHSNKFITGIIRQLISNKEEIQLTTGLQRRDFIYVNDAAAAFLNVLNRFDYSRMFIEYEVGTGHSTSIREIVEKLQELSGSSSVLKFGVLPMRNGEFEESRADTSALSAIGWAPEFDINTALKETILFERNLLKL